ncbi:MAG: hypothetical protein JXR91_03810 [Deltaproteobacteria bacterium]|nr:hypothetical protein [Deltaproteobacteria bacterium]
MEMEQYKINEEAMMRRRREEFWSLSHSERMRRFEILQENSIEMMSKEGVENFHRRNHKKRAVTYNNGVWGS